MNKFPAQEQITSTNPKIKFPSNIPLIVILFFIIIFIIISKYSNIQIKSNNRLRNQLDGLVKQSIIENQLIGSKIIDGRMLEDSGNTGSSIKNWDSQTIQTNIYIIVLIIGLSVLGMGVFICISIIIYKCFIQPYLNMLRARGLLSNGNKIINIDNDFMDIIDIVAPELDYGIFIKEVGKSVYENCVICLEEFENNINNNEFMISDDKKIKSKIVLTVCGHILHSKCMKQWIDRQPKCPLCREELSNQNIQKWEEKLGINIKQMYKYYFHLSKKIKNRQNISQPILKFYDQFNVINRSKKTKNTLTTQHKILNLKINSNQNNHKYINSLPNQVLQQQVQQVNNDHYDSIMNINIAQSNKNNNQLNNLIINHQQQQQMKNKNQSKNIYCIMELYAIQVYLIIMKYHHKFGYIDNEANQGENGKQRKQIYPTEEIKNNTQDVEINNRSYPQKPQESVAQVPQNQQARLNTVNNKNNDEINVKHIKNKQLAVINIV